MLRLFSRAKSIKRVSCVRSFSSSSKPEVWVVDNPYTGETVCTKPTLSLEAASSLISASHSAFTSFSSSPLSTRLSLLSAWLRVLSSPSTQHALASSISNQMGKPLSQSMAEVSTCIARTERLMQMAPKELEPEEIEEGAKGSNIKRRITKEPIGPVLVLSPWNYPLICAVNSVVAAILSGCSVIIKHSDRTPEIADLFQNTFREAGAPKDLVQAFHASHSVVHSSLANPKIAYVSFTGSVAGGRAVYKSVANSRFIDVGLELGGKDAAYVASDANLEYAIPNIVDGGMYNAGQSCCAVERVYVHKSKYQDFLNGIVSVARSYKLGSPLSSSVTLGPLAQPGHGRFLLGQVSDAVSQGASLLTGGHITHDELGKGRFFEPTVLANCTHKMSVMVDESFGPVLAVAAVEDDEEAVRLVNDSPYGLTASIWSENEERALKIGAQLNVGTVYQNRCDFLDASLPWSGRQDSGKGISLSRFAFQPFYRTKGWNRRPTTK